MEDEYRRARGILDTLAPEQIADLYVRLTAAIGGDFYVIEADEEKIVLGNRACPFGEVVRRAPGLCRMTSSVFGRHGTPAARRWCSKSGSRSETPNAASSCGSAPTSAGAGKPRTSTATSRADQLALAPGGAASSASSVPECRQQP
jgi:hypothetical protein